MSTSTKPKMPNETSLKLKSRPRLFLRSFTAP